MRDRGWGGKLTLTFVQLWTLALVNQPDGLSATAQLHAVSLEQPLGGGGGTRIPRTGGGEEPLSAGRLGTDPHTA